VISAACAWERYLHAYRSAVELAVRTGGRTEGEEGARLKAGFLYTAAARMDWYLALAGLDDSIVSFLPFGVAAPVKGGGSWVVSIPLWPLDAALEDAGLPEPVYLDVLVADREALVRVAAGLVRSVGEGRVVGGGFLFPPPEEDGGKPPECPLPDTVRWLAGKACERGPVRTAVELTAPGHPVSTAVVQALKALARARKEGVV